MAKLINILLRKTDPDYPWGFSLGAVPPAIHSIQITWVDENSLAAEHLEPGDRVLEIEGMDTTMLSTPEVESLLTSPSSKLELLIMKKTKSTKCGKGAAATDDVTKTVKTKETVLSTTEEMATTELLSEDLIRESKIITTEGTLHKQVMETTDFSEEQETNTFWTSNTITKPSKTGIAEHKASKSDFQNTDSYKTLQRDQNLFGTELNNVSSTSSAAKPCDQQPTKPNQFSSGYNQQTKPKTINQEPITQNLNVSSSGSNCFHEQLRGTQSSSKNAPKVDTFWTCPPSDLVNQGTKKKAREENLACRNTSSSSYISDSQIFKSLNNYRDELREIDPREEKRRFWESCRKGDSIRRFKWGDSIKPSRVSSTTASTECLYNKTDSQPVNIPKTERSRSCEPMENHSPSNPFSKSFNDYQIGSGVSPTNPFYKEFETLNQNCRSFLADTQVSSSDSNFQYSNESNKTEMDKTFSCYEDNDSSRFPVARSCSPNYEFIGDMKGSEQIAVTSEYSTLKRKESATNNYQAAAPNATNQNEGFRPTKAMSKEEFESKCKFFEKATSTPVLCVNSEAKGLVEERLKEQSPSPIVANTVETVHAGQTRQNCQGSADVSKPIPRANIIPPEVHHPLMKPSDFINQQLKHKTSVESSNAQGPIPKITISEATTSSNENCYSDSSRSPETESSFMTTKFDENKCASKAAAQKVEPIYENLRHQSQAETMTCDSSLPKQARNVTNSSNAIKDSTFVHQEARNHFQTVDTDSQINTESNFYPATNTNRFSSRASEIQASREERLRESLNKKIEWFFDGMKPNEVLNDQSQFHSGNSSERDFYEKRTFKESSFEKVTRSSHSPYENVESASSREYQEESGPGKNFAARSRTPAGFYDNATVDEFGRELRAKSPMDISLKSFQDIRSRLGSLLGGTPANIQCSHTKLQISQGGVDNVEEAFQKLAIQEGIVDSTSGVYGTNLRIEDGVAAKYKSHF